MEYPKPIMSKRELMNMGFPEQWLTKVSNMHRQKVCFQSGQKSNCKLWYDTVELEKVRIADCRSGRA